MEENEQYLKAWTEGDEPGTADPVVSAVKAARQADADEFADAFKNDKFEKEKKADKKDGDEK